VQEHGQRQIKYAQWSYTSEIQDEKARE
jgi:hypothetical protein